MELANDNHTSVWDISHSSFHFKVISFEVGVSQLRITN